VSDTQILQISSSSSFTYRIPFVQGKQTNKKEKEQSLFCTWSYREEEEKRREAEIEKKKTQREWGYRKVPVPGSIHEPSRVETSAWVISEIDLAGENGP
jgi:hypothetical protein